MICEKCGYEERDGAFFCRNCGKLLDPAGYSSKSVYETEEHRIMRMVENLKHHPHYDILWDDTMDLYAAKVEKFQSILGTGVLDIDQGSLDDLKDKFKVFLKECRHPEFQIAFVGTIKTGKSTLINALLGHNYSSTAVTPETAALAKFRSSEKDYINVTFFSPEEWNKLWKSREGADSFMREYKLLGAAKEKKRWVGHDMIHCELANEAIEQELNKWSSSKSPQHFFVKEIEVGLSSLPKDFPKQVVFVDTPGLSDPVAQRSEISRQYIKQANAVFVCVEAQKMNKEELKTISAVLSFSAHDKRKVFIVATHWDTMNDPVKDWAEQRAYLVKKLTGPAFYDSAEMADANILHSSAFIHNLCRDYDTLSEDALMPLMRFAVTMRCLNSFTLTKDDIQKLDDYSNIHQIRALIRDRLLKNYSELFYGDLKQRYDKLFHLLHRNATDLRASYQERIDATGKDLAGILQDFEQKKKDADEIRNGRDQLKAELDAVKERTNQRINKYQKFIKNLNEK